MAYRQQYDDSDTPEETWARALKVGYDEVAQELMPDRFRELLERLEDADATDDRSESRDLQSNMVNASVPGPLRTGRPD